MPHGFDFPSPPFSSLPKCCAAAGHQEPPPPFLKAVEWLDSSKPCWLSRSLFRAIVWPRRRSRPSRGTAPLRVYFGSSDWSACVCVYVASLGYRQPGRRGSILWTYAFVYPAISTTLDFSAGIAIYGGVCVNIPEQACGSMAGRLERDVPYSVRPPVSLPSGTADKGDGSSQIRTEGATSKGKELGLLFLFPYACLRRIGRSRQTRRDKTDRA